MNNPEEVQRPPIPEQPKRVFETLDFQVALQRDALMALLDAASDRAFLAEYGEQNTAESYSEAITDCQGNITVLRSPGGELIGAGIVRYYDAGFWGEDAQASQELSHTFILPEHQGQGHGAALTEERIRQCVERGGHTWSILNRGKMQLEYYRSLIESEAANQGKHVHEWISDPTTESYAYAYIEEEDGALVIFQGRTPNGDSMYRSVVTVSQPAISPDMLAKSGQISTPQVRRDFGGLSKSIGVTQSEFTAIQDIVSSALSGANFEELQAKDGGYPQVLSVTIV